MKDFPGKRRITDRAKIVKIPEESDIGCPVVSMPNRLGWNYY